MVFSLKLESGHKLLCPWINNACTEELAQFPIVSRACLRENYKKRFLALSNLTALPVILPVAIGNIRSSELEQFLGESSASEYQEPLENSRGKLPGHVPETISSNLYYQALKLISLFGWEPHILPYNVDFKDGQNQSIRDANITVTTGQKMKANVFSWCTREGNNTNTEVQLDPSSVVLDCNLCAARVGLWAFYTTPRPLEYLRFVGVTEVTGKNITTRDEVITPEGSGYQIPIGNREGITNTVNNASTSLGFTIAGGPPPALLNYGATISLPIIGPNVRARVFMGKDTKDHLAVQKQSQAEGQKMSLKIQNTTMEGSSATTVPDFLVRNPLEVPQSVANHRCSDAGEISCSTPLDNTVSKNCGGRNNRFGEEMAEAENCEDSSSYKNNCLDNPGVEPFVKHKPVPFSIRENKKIPFLYKPMEFDPIKQHRHFCPWIMPTGRLAPGWQQTLSVLPGYKELDNVHLPFLIEVDDPVASAKRLFTIPLYKGKKIDDESCCQ
ncbi:hypothetical protein OROMI_003531 [Orobanche minor]